ncbi:MAG: hypothetical protein JSU64_02595 [candidate division WOR-3 bacterium]|nr:MAG: hypothetical protein JSU64_02595 [candidate division WOR-3 bacterium]
MRLALGMPYNSPGVYTHVAWFVLYPVQLLRQMDDQSIFILFYVLLWSYVLIVRVIVYDAPLGRAFLRMLIWMAVVALPFLPLGIEYLSLARYSTTINNYVLRLLPFGGLLVSLFLCNHIYFKQSYRVAGAWAIVNFVLIIMLITLADLLPMLKSRIFLHSLGYRVSVINTFLSTMPVLSLLLAIFLSIFYIVMFERRFVRIRGKKSRLLSVVIPVGVSIALFLVLLILRDDFRRYRFYDYRGGIATTYFAAYDDRILVSFDRNEVRIARGRQSVFYPFGKFSGEEILKKDAAEIIRMKLIEGLDYYRLARILAIVAHGPRDTLLYRGLRPLISGTSHRVPNELKPWADYLDHRYEMPSGDITVTGWIKVNGVDLALTEFFVNKVMFSQERALEPVWQGRTDPEGKFHFSCYSDPRSSDGYFQVSFLLPDTVIGIDIRSLKVGAPLPVVFNPGDYVFDTVSISVGRGGVVSQFKRLSILASAELDSFELILSDMAPSIPYSMSGSVTASGELRDIALECASTEVDTSKQNVIIEEMSASRFHLREQEGTVVVRRY